MKIVVIGGSGLIGTKRVSRLRRKRHEVVAASQNRPESASRARIREQIEPSEAYERLYHGFIHPTFEVMAGLIARITGGDPDDEQVRLQIPELSGAILVLRAARATVLRELRWDSIGRGSSRPSEA